MYSPLRLSPHFTDNIWGGNKLENLFGKKSGLSVCGESWELACHRDGKCTIQEGQFVGKTLQEVALEDPEGYIGFGRTGKRFPVLVKFIDANAPLSIQVHPSDENADEKNGEQGKAEMWYVVDAAPGAFIYYGLSKKISPETLEEMIKGGSVCDVLNKVRVSKGDVFYILPGTVHAIGKGILIAEIQQSSDTTFRLYDYGRVDSNGNPRKLNIKRAKEVMCFDPIIPEEIKDNCSATFPEFTMNEMFSCRYFKAYRLDVNRKIDLFTDGSTFEHLLFISGEGEITCRGKNYPYKSGDSFFIPAKTGEFSINGKCRVLLTRT